MSKKDDDHCHETVLVLQGGGSLGAYECGVYKAVDKLKIKCDIVAGTSIGGINAAIISGSKSGKASEDLENFWFTLAETVTPFYLPEKMRQIAASSYSAIWGNPNAFVPVWFGPSVVQSYHSPFLYDITPLKKTLEEYVDFSKLGSSGRPRLVITSVDVQTSKRCIFDSKKDVITAKHVIAGAGYPFYGISWTKVDDKYLWDGTLLSNTPLSEVIEISPYCDKNVIVVNLFPQNQEKLPTNLIESWHRARDIMHTAKTDQTVKLSKIISRYLLIIKKMHHMLESDEVNKKKIQEMESEYQELTRAHGGIIKQIVRVERNENIPFLFEDADFSLQTIKDLITAGEKDAMKALSNFGKHSTDDKIH